MLSNYNETVIPNLITFFKNKGLNENAISGLCGNIYVESRFYPNNLQNSYEKKMGMSDDEYAVAVDNGTYTNFVSDRAGWGLVQLTSSGRKQGFLDYVKAKGKSISDLNSQLEYIWKELNESSYKKQVLPVLLKGESIDECARAVMLYYERPKNQSEENQLIRVGYAQDFYNIYFKPSVALVEPSNKGFNYNFMIMTNNDCYKANYPMKPQGIVVHSTGANNPNLRRYIQPDDGIIGVNPNHNDWNRSGVEKCVHAFIGKDKNGVVRTYQTLPWTICCWGCGRWQKKDKNGKVIEERGSYNYPPTTKHPMDKPYIQFEICEDALNDKKYFNDVMNTAMDFCAYLCTKFNISVDNVVSHHESYLQGMASNHSDIDHWLGLFGRDMDWFRAQVKARLTAVERPQSDDKTTDDKTSTQTVYTAVKGDTLYGIGKKYGVKWQLIANANGITFPYRINVGQKLTIPLKS